MTNNTPTGALANNDACVATIVQQLSELGLVAKPYANWIEVGTVSHPEIKLFVRFSLRRKDVHVGAQRKKGFALTEAGIKNPKAVAQRIVELVQDKADRHHYAAERELREQALKVKVVEAGFEVNDYYTSGLVLKRYKGGDLRADYDYRNVELSVSVPAEKLALVKEFLDKLAQ